MRAKKQTIVALRKRVRKLQARRKKLVIELAERSAELSEAREDARRLRGAIETHREQTGHNLCWLNDVALWEQLRDGKTDYPHAAVPPREEFLIGCQAYWKSRFESCPTPVIIRKRK